MTGAMIKTEGPRPASRTDRRRIKADIRNELGTSRDPAPHVSRVIRAARKLDDLLRLTTNGRYRIVIEVREGDDYRAAGVADFETTKDRWAE
jgi:hypothetical protein